MTDPARVEEIFKAALDHPTPDRRAYVVEACGSDDALRNEVEALLDADDAADGFLESPLRSLALDPQALTGRNFGPYEIVAEIGRGGMGVVYEARQQRPARSVALKVVRAGLGGPGAVERFLHEIEVLGRLRHAGIAQIYAADVHAGVPYYAMELIAEAVPITRYADDGDLSIEARMRLVALACDAVQHGHDRGVIHRDIKPSNVVVGGDGVPKVIDFGVARASDPGGAEAYTATGHIVGTVRYMSPEQRTVDGDVDVRSDVYALGLVLYEVLVGRYPFDVRGATPLTLVKELERAQVVPPSAVVPGLRGDPETILLRALAREPGRRYASARALAEDLRRCVRGEPIEARRDDLRYLLRKALGRHKVAVIGGLAAAALLVGSGFAWVRTLEAERTARAVDRAEAAEVRAEQADELRKSTYALRIALAGHAYVEQNLGRMRMLLAKCPEALRGWEWRRMSWLSDRSAAKVRAHAGTIEAAAFDPSGERLASAGADGAVYLWRLADGRLTRTMTLVRERGHLFALAWTPDGSSVAVAGEAPTIDVLDASTGALKHSFAAPEHVRGLAVSDDGARLASAADDDTFRVWDLESEQAVATLEIGDQALAVAFTPDGDLITGSADERLRRWDLETSEPHWEIHPVEDAIETIAISPDGDRIALAGWDPEIVIVDASSGETQARLPGHADGVREVRWIPSGDEVVSAGWDDIVRVWDVESEQQVLELRGHESNVEALAVAADGRHVVSGAADRQLRLWDLERGPDHRVLSGHGEKVHTFAFTPDGSRLVTGSGPHFDTMKADASLRIWDVVSGETLRVVSGLEQGVVALAIDPSGRLAAAGDRAGRIRIEALEPGAEPRVLPGHEGLITSVAWRGDVLLSTGVDGALVQWNVRTLAAEHRLRLPATPTSILVLADDGVVIGLADGSLRLWRSGESTTALATVAFTEIRGLATVGADRIAVAAQDGTLAVVDAQTGSAVWSVDTYDGGLSSVAVNPNGDRIAVGDTEFNVRLFDARRGDELMLVGRHDSFVTAVAFSPDGERLASSGFDRVVRLWETGG